jgi:predicted CoA-binding protein
MPSRASIDTFLAQDHIAFVGASRNPKSFASGIYRQLRPGRTLYPVNGADGADVIDGDRCYRTLAEVPDPVDGVFVIVPAAAMAGVVRDAVARGIPRIWLHRGAGQKPVPAQAVEIARAAGLDIIDGACPLMFEEPVKGIHRFHRLLIKHRVAA